MKNVKIGDVPIKAICYLLALVSTVSSQTTKSSVPSSPCPNVFTYEPLPSDEKPGVNKWYGTINLSTDITLYALWLNVILDTKAEILGNWVGEVTTEDNYNFKIENTKTNLYPGGITPVRFFIQYNTNAPVPKVKSILFNGREICQFDELKAVTEKSISVANNYNLSNGVFIKFDTTSTTPRSTTVSTTKNIYDKYTTRNQNKQTTTTPNYWTQTKVEVSRATTERSPTKSTTTSNLWNWLQPNVENTPPTKTPVTSQAKNKDQNATGSISQSSSQTKSKTSGSSDITQTKRDNTIQHSVGEVHQQAQSQWLDTKVFDSKQQARPAQNEDPRPVITVPIRSESKLEVKPVKRNESALAEKSSQQYNADSIRDKVKVDYNDRSVYSQSPLDDHRLTTARPTFSSFLTLDDYEDPPKVTEDDSYDVGGIPTLYIPNLRPEDIEPLCGKVVKKPPRYLPQGSSTSEGQWPWQTALYQQQTVDYKYICGGTLVSRQHVITAAHCVTKRRSQRIVNKNTLQVYLGKFNLRTSADGVQVQFVSRIVVHPEYNATIFSHDLAVLRLRESVSYTSWVRPACLWPENESGVRHIIGKKGSVVGWGYEVTGAAKEELSLLEMPVVDQDTCIDSLTGFYENFSSSYTYCAGYKPGTTVCNGDSGGGMVFKKSGTWYLRGLASLSVARQNEYRCDPKHYVIFTDLAKFLPWIEDQIDN